ncbi:hypothetical protein KXD93_24565 [Mucilaginibacter sp. BJC16-A38]|uniref:hypothetical protein n=1 Tax=Mucilaginibacter phenanthrenivorans TaxID=1234842 RepID=UPI002157B5FF|nr:hypothetical protein [Mucilaginibacter phenanthrenivorans]MCR8560854.1 hypothetical protein [Mucilaginibacter phenanthrenivorans]
MNVNRILVEQIDWDGTSKSIAFDNRTGNAMWIAFPNEYDEKKIGPFYFKNSLFQSQFAKQFKASLKWKLKEEQFNSSGELYFYKTQWNSIPVEINSNTYYALYLPEFAIPNSIEVTNAVFGKGVPRNVWKDLEVNRYIIYILGPHSQKSLSFKIECKFTKDKDGFSNSKYSDKFDSDFYGHPSEWKHEFDSWNLNQQSFFAQQVIINNRTQDISKKNNPWLSGSFYLFVLIVVIITIAVIAKFLPWYSLPIIVIGSILIIGVIGALQLRNDGELSEDNFIKLMVASYKRLPLLRQKSNQKKES